ncbi:hypothetical protein NVP2275O_025 [Vibrio phage 2.275.O._10N.286.54.E11]|nr:hypothetical protein NVP2275O_025 [Vibrio phage 2.275.O._10N.286.54.E11]
MEIFEFESKTQQAQKLAKYLQETYAFDLNLNDLNAGLVKSARKIRYLKEHNLDTPTSETWVKENVIHQTYSLYIELSESINVKQFQNTQTVITPIKENEMANKNLSKLFESEIEKAQIVMAVRNEIVDKLQRDAEKMSNMKVDVLGPIVDRIKAEHGIEAAGAFNELTGTLLDQALNTLMDVKDKISTETLKLTGDVAGGTDMSADFALDAEAEELSGVPIDDIPSFDMETETEFTDDPDLEPLPAEREVKESYSRLGVDLESKTGNRGKKYFTSKEEMKTWLSENQSMIKKVHKIIKE